ncbi:hypothetical protein D3C80_2150160 [compost metagenome]
MVQTGRKRIEEHMVRVKLPTRLPKWMVDSLVDMGGLTENLEKAVIMYLKANGKLGK